MVVLMKEIGRVGKAKMEEVEKKKEWKSEEGRSWQIDLESVKRTKERATTSGKQTRH